MFTHRGREASGYYGCTRQPPVGRRPQDSSSSWRLSCPGGGDVVCEAKDHIAWWQDSEVGEYLADVREHEREEGGRLVLHLRQPEHDPETVYVVNGDDNTTKTKEDKKGASAIHFDSRVARIYVQHSPGCIRTSATPRSMIWSATSDLLVRMEP